MKNRINKRRIHQLQQNRYIPLTAEDKAWLNMAPLGREFGSKDYERLTRFDALADLEIPPGEILLKEFCEPKGITPAQLAISIGLPQNRMEALVSGSQPVTDDIALSLGLFFNMEADFWINLQTEYDRRIERTKP